MPIFEIINNLTVNNLSMGNDESFCCDDLKNIRITPTRIPIPWDNSLYKELKKMGIIFKKHHSILKFKGNGYEIISEIADVCLPKGFGILKINDNNTEAGYYLINDKNMAVYYMWTNESRNWKTCITCGMERLPKDGVKREVDIKKCGLYEGWWLTHEQIKNEHLIKINNYKKELEKYNSYSTCDSLMIDREYHKILTKYNELTQKVPADFLVSNGISAPVKLPCTAEQVFF